MKSKTTKYIVKIAIAVLPIVLDLVNQEDGEEKKDVRDFYLSRI
jgi:hypothetical protein